MFLFSFMSAMTAATGTMSAAAAVGTANALAAIMSKILNENDNTNKVE